MIREADEAAPTKAAALRNLSAQAAKDEATGGLAALDAGATLTETELAIEIGRLARTFYADVLARRAAGDHHAEYHARRPKVRAYGLLMSLGCSPKEAVQRFKELLAEVKS